MDRLTKNNYQDDLFEFQATKKVRVDEYTEISYKQHNYNEDLWKAVKEKEEPKEEEPEVEETEEEEEIKQKYYLTELEVAYRASNGETGYSIKK